MNTYKSSPIFQAKILKYGRGIKGTVGEVRHWKGNDLQNIFLS